MEYSLGLAPPSSPALVVLGTKAAKACGRDILRHPGIRRVADWAEGF